LKLTAIKFKQLPTTPASLLAAGVVAVLLCCLAALIVCEGDALAQDDSIEVQIEKDCPFVVYVEMSELPQFLNYRGSTIPSPTCLDVTYRRREAANYSLDPPRRYEYLLYKNGKPLGLRRYAKLSIQQDGVIYARRSNSLNSHPDALANALARLLLDILATKAVVRTAYVPKEIFDEVIAGLMKMGFQKFTLVTAGDQAVVIHVSSNPPGFDRYLRHGNAPSN
jgi:hypothetical protein